jgi:hypothetical protein
MHTRQTHAAEAELRHRIITRFLSQATPRQRELLAFVLLGLRLMHTK